MTSNWITLLLLGLIITNVFSPAYARIHFERLSATEVYKALREAGRLDAVPEGRVVTQGIAAATGFIAGITKGIGIPLLLGLAMPRPSSSNGEQMTTQEICFSSRSVDEIDDDNEANKENDGNDGNDESHQKSEETNDKPEGRQETPTTTAGGTNTATTAPDTATTGTSPTTGTSVTPTTTTAATPTTTTGTNDGTGGGTTTDGGDGTGTNTESTTQTGTGGAVNCIIIQKPVKG